MAREIERKLLVSDDLKSSAFAQSRTMQGCICSTRGRTMRVHTRDDKDYLIIKGTSDESGISRYGWERELPLSGAEELVKLCESGMISKAHYLVRSGNHVFGIDEFYGKNEGFIVVKVELGTEDEASVKPRSINEEVIGDVHYYNSHLVKRPYKMW